MTAKTEGLDSQKLSHNDDDDDQSKEKMDEFSVTRIQRQRLIRQSTPSPFSTSFKHSLSRSSPLAHTIVQKRSFSLDEKNGALKREEETQPVDGKESLTFSSAVTSASEKMGRMVTDIVMKDAMITGIIKGAHTDEDATSDKRKLESGSHRHACGIRCYSIESEEGEEHGSTSGKQEELPPQVDGSSSSSEGDNEDSVIEIRAGGEQEPEETSLGQAEFPPPPPEVIVSLESGEGQQEGKDVTSSSTGSEDRTWL